MFNLIKTVLLFLSLFAGILAAGHNSCRQCKGSHTLIFKDYATIEQVKDYVAHTLGNCATGAEYGLTVNTQGTCLQGSNESSCKYWNLQIMAWRYCGNGGRVDLKQANVCVGNVCSAMDNLLMDCWKSVECHGLCDNTFCSGGK